jgi:peptide/nickel transport system ATP-binding protein/oligopeptide transport system ATP-binding protein
MLLELNNITKTFSTREGGQKRALRAVDGVSLSVTAGESLGIVGESGCGKTTLARIILGLVKPDTGSVHFEGQDPFVAAASLAAFRQRVRMVFQDPFAALDPRFTVRAVLAEAVMGRAGTGAMLEALRSVGLPQDILGRYPHEFSGGERQRICVARALMTRPSLIVLDEAVSALDVLVQRQVLDTLKVLQDANGITFLFISHNLTVVQYLCPKIAVMRAGGIVEYGLAAEVLASPVHPYTKELLKSAREYGVE